MNRRDLINGLTTKNKSKFVPHIASPGAQRLTNAILKTHDNKEVKFYDDLIKGRQVVINFMYADCHGACPMVTEVLKKIYDVHKDRMGRDLFFYSISVKPETDTPEALKAYAEMHKADRKGWLFLTGNPHELETIRFRLHHKAHPGIDTDFAMHAGRFRIINDATNCWTMAEAFASQKTILQHLSWADPPKSYEQRLAESKLLQVKIDEEVKLYGYRKTV